MNHEKILEFYYRYSLADVAKSLFILDLYPLSIGSPVRMSLLWEILRNSDPQHYQSNSLVKSYAQFDSFTKELIGLLPSLPMVEDTLVDVEWGDIKFKFEGSAYRIFYHGEIENPYDYLLALDRYAVANAANIVTVFGRNPRIEVGELLKLQHDVIEKVNCEPVKVDYVKADDLTVPSRTFWKSASAYYEALTVSDFDPAFVSNYTLPISPDQKFKYEDLPELFLAGRTGLFAFLSHDSSLYPASSRHLLPCLFTKIADLAEDKRVTYSRPMLNKAIHGFLSERFSGVLGPLVVEASKPEESLEYAAAFMVGSKLFLIYTFAPNDTGQDTVDQVFKKADDNLKALKAGSSRVLDPITMQVVEWHGNNDEAPDPHIMVIAPHLSTEFKSFTLPRTKGVQYVLADEFFLIFDDLEKPDDYEAFGDFLERMDPVTMPMARLIDKYGAFKDTAGTITQGATIPNAIALLGAVGGGYRFKRLKQFWKAYPPTGWGGDDIGAWGVSESKPTRFYMKKDHFKSSLYTRSGKVDVFALGPFDLVHDDVEAVQCSDLLCQIAIDYFDRYPRILNINKYVPHGRLKVVVLPQQLRGKPPF